MAKLLIVLGAVMLLAGIFGYIFGDRLSWIGNLPGDIRIERGNFHFYFPLTTGILASILFSLVWKIIRTLL